MEETIIRPDTKSSYTNILSIATFLVGAVLLGFLAWDYMNGTLPENWVYSFVIGMGAIAASFSIRYRHLFVQQPELRIDGTGITSKNTSIWGGKSIEWTDVKAISLTKNKIQVQYRQSGSNDDVHLPTIGSQERDQIDRTLNEAAASFDIVYNQR